MSADADEELITLDEATVWLTVHEQVADARQSLAAARDPASRVRILRDLACGVRREIAVLPSWDSLVMRELLALVDAELSLACEERAP